MANLITLFRLLLLFGLVGMAYEAPPVWQQLNALLLVVVISLDGVDGYIARRRGEASVFGSIFDIAVDRIVENVLWIVLADLDLVPIWVALIFITRGLLVDAIRSHGAAQGQAAFSMLHSGIGRFLVASRFMRGFYGVVKALAFGWILFFQPWPALYPELWQDWGVMIQGITEILVYMSVILCLLRALPVLMEFAGEGGLTRSPGNR